MTTRMRLGELGVRRLRSGLLAAVCAGGTVLYLTVLGRHYPVDTWLSWRLGALYGWLALFCIASVSAGSAVLERLLPGVRLARLEALVLSMAVGVVTFAFGMYVGGALAWFGPYFAVLLSLTMGLLGSPSLRRLLAATKADSVRPSFGGTAAHAAGFIGVLLIYFCVMTPEAINYDATWSHLTVAQDYAREGRLVAFPADYNKQVPHLASIIYSWGFMVPGLDLMGHWMLAQHLEFAMLLWTLAGVGAAIQWIVRAPLPGAWAAFFLFPSIFVYDHNLGTAADHVLAFFGPPVLLAARRFFPRLAYRPAVLLGIVLGGAALTKYQAMYFVVPLGTLVALRTAWLLLGDLRRDRTVHKQHLLGPLVLAGALVLSMSPHFIKNVVFHGNPVYPFMQQVFSTSHPVCPDSVVDFQNIYLDQNWVPKGTATQKLWSTLQIFFTFSFLPHYNFYGGLPMFGSLFTLLLPCVLFLRRNLRLIFAIALPSGGLLMWASTFLVDRNLQILLPLLAAATGSLIVEVWRTGIPARLGLVPLVALQLIWGGDQPFYSGSPRLRDSIELVRSGFDKRAATRFDHYLRPFREVGANLPKGAKVLMHSTHQSLGVDQEVVLDWQGFQALIHYGHVHNVRELVLYYQKLGITHLVYKPHERMAPTKQEEVLWQMFAQWRSPKTKHIEQLRLIPMPKDLPTRTESYRVLCVGLEGYVDGVYDIANLNTNEYLVPELRNYRPPQVAVADVSEARVQIPNVDAVLVGPHRGYEGSLKQDLRSLSSSVKFAGSYALYLRKP